MAMRSLSFVTTSVLILSLFISLVVYSSCKKEGYTYIDRCEGVTCENNGNCIDGSCSCTLGYTGDRCEKKAIAPYIGKWRVTQKVTSSGKEENVGKTTTYDIEVSEGEEGVTILKIKGFWGEPESIIYGKIGHKIGTEDIGGVITEIEVLAPTSNYIIRRYQPITNTGLQILKGEGSINTIGTILSADVTVTYADSTLGVVEEVVSISANFIQ